MRSIPRRRKYYWQLIDKGLFRIGADAWWLDTDEPETEGRETSVLVNNKAAIGSGARYANLFSLMTTEAVYKGSAGPPARSAYLFFRVRRPRGCSATPWRRGRATWSPTG